MSQFEIRDILRGTYTGMTELKDALLAKAVQELYDRIEILERHNKELQVELSDMRRAMHG